MRRENTAFEAKKIRMKCVKMEYAIEKSVFSSEPPLNEPLHDEVQ